MGLHTNFRPVKRSLPMTVSDELDIEVPEPVSGPSNEPKTKKTSNVLRRTVPGCQSFITQHVFKIPQNYQKHIK